METDRNRKDATGRGGRIERIVFGVVLSLFSLAWLALTFAVDARERASRRWPEVPCTILGTETAWESTGTAPHRHSFPILRVRYRYEWNGVARESDVFSTNERGPNIERASERERWTSIYRPGAASTCLVNPDNPDEAVLHAMMTSPIPFFCVGFAGLAAGFWLLAGPRLRRRRTDPAADARPALPPETPPDPRRFRLWFGAAFFAGGLLFAALGALWLAREAADPVVSPPWSPPPRVGAWMFTGLGALFAAVGAAIALFAAIRPRRLPEGKLPRSGRLRRAWATDRFTATLATAVAAAGMAALFRRFVPQDEAMPRLFTGFLVLFAAGNGCAALWLALRFLFARRYEIEWTNGPMVPGRPFTVTFPRPVPPRRHRLGGKTGRSQAGRVGGRGRQAPRAPAGPPGGSAPRLVRADDPRVRPAARHGRGDLDAPRARLGARRAAGERRLPAASDRGARTSARAGRL